MDYIWNKKENSRIINKSTYCEKIDFWIFKRVSVGDFNLSMINTAFEWSVFGTSDRKVTFPDIILYFIFYSFSYRMRSIPNVIIDVFLSFHIFLGVNEIEDIILF